MPDQKFPHLWNSIFFWFVVFGVALFKVATSSTKTRSALALTLIAAVFSAAAFTESVVEYFKLGDTSLQYGVAGLMALTGEHIMRLIVGFAQEPKKALALWREWKGGTAAK